MSEKLPEGGVADWLNIEGIGSPGGNEDECIVSGKLPGGRPVIKG